LAHARGSARCVWPPTARRSAVHNHDLNHKVSITQHTRLGWHCQPFTAPCQGSAFHDAGAATCCSGQCKGVREMPKRCRRDACMAAGAGSCDSGRAGGAPAQKPQHQLGSEQWPSPPAQLPLLAPLPPPLPQPPPQPPPQPWLLPQSSSRRRRLPAPLPHAASSAFPPLLALLLGPPAHGLRPRQRSGTALQRGCQARLGSVAHVTLRQTKNRCALQVICCGVCTRVRPLCERAYSLCFSIIAHIKHATWDCLAAWVASTDANRQHRHVSGVVSCVSNQKPKALQAAQPLAWAHQCRAHQACESVRCSGCSVPGTGLQQ